LAAFPPSALLTPCAARLPEPPLSSYAGRPAGEAEFAVALWWRASALQALSAYALGVISKGLSPDPQAAVRGLPVLPGSLGLPAALPGALPAHSPTLCS
jgi:hypothetical protein